MRYILVLVLMVFALPGAAQDFSALNAPGSIAIMRHALAPGFSDPSSFDVDDCTTQRNLDARGRAQAERTGAALRDAGIEFDAVWTSQWCRCRDTAELMDLGEVTEVPALNSFFENRDQRSPQTEALRARLAEWPATERLMMVTHQVNITALTGRGTQSGEILVLKRDGQGGFEVTDSILIAP